MSPTSYQLLHPAMFIYFNMAEEEGFEPPRRFHALSVFKTDPFSRTWVFLHFSIFVLVAEEGLEPPTSRV